MYQQPPLSYRPPDSPSPAPNRNPGIPGSYTTIVGSGVAFLSFLFMPWLNLSIFGSYSGWGLINLGSQFSGLCSSFCSSSTSSQLTVFILCMWLILLSTLAALGIGIAGVMGRGNKQLTIAQIVSGFIALILLGIGLYGFLQASANQTSASVQINYFSFLGFGVYIAIIGLIASIVGGFITNREHWA